MNRILAILALVCTVLPTLASAANGDLSFQSFYKEDNTFFWAGAALAAIVAGAIIFYSAGTATPVVSGVGTWIGGLMGYSGAAATNAGLAWLGGGALAAGGYGMAGGAALLTAVFTFGTEIVVDATIANRQSAYDYARFTAQTRKMVTLPLPRNGSGPDSVEAAFKILKKIDRNANPRDPEIQTEIERALAALNSTPDDSDDSPDAEETARKKTFAAVLELIVGETRSARNSAAEAYRIAEQEQILRVVPAFVLAVTELHEEKPDVARADAYLKYAMNGEKDNPLTPLMVKMYSDRLTSRISGGSLHAGNATGIVRILASQPDDKRSAMNYAVMAGQLFSAIKIEQQHLLYLLRTDNQALLASERTDQMAAGLLSRFRALIAQANQLLLDGDLQLTKQLDEGTFSVTPSWAKSWAREWLKFHALLGAYKDQVPELVQELERFKGRFQATSTEPKASEGESSRNSAWTIALLGALLASGFAGGVIYERRRKLLVK